MRGKIQREGHRAFQQGAVLLFSAVGVQGWGQSRDLEGGARKPKAKQSEVLSKKRRPVEDGALREFLQQD